MPSYPLKVVTNTGNAKLGPGVAATYRPVGDAQAAGSCPPCPLASICYAQRGRVSIHQSRSRESSDFLGKLNGAPLVRHLVSGDAFRTSAGARPRQILDRPYLRDLIDYHERHPYSVGWTYSHGAASWDRAGFGPAAWPSNFACLASCSDLATARDHWRRGWRTARVVDTPAEATRDETLCPYDLAKYRGRSPKTNCANCRLCLPGRTENIVFVAF